MSNCNQILKGGLVMYNVKKVELRVKEILHFSSIHILFLFLIGMCFVFVVGTHAQVPTLISEPSLAERVFGEHETFLVQETTLELLPAALEEIKKPDNQKLLTPETIASVLEDPDRLKTLVPDIDDKFITLLKENQAAQAFLRDADVQTLLQDTAAIEELTSILATHLAERVFTKYKDFFEREDISEILPEVLIQLKTPDIQELLNPITIKIVIENPEALKTFLPQIDDEFITLLKEDAEVIAVISDPNVQSLLQNIKAIEKFTVLLELSAMQNVVVRIVPASVVTPQVGEQLVITVDIADGKGAAGYQGTLQFDPTALRFVSLTHGTFLTGQVQPLETIVEENQITFAQITTDTPSEIDEGTLVTITFEVVDAVASVLSLSEVIIAELGGVPWQVTVENAEILAPPRPWDVNGDNSVNILDLTYVASYFGDPDAPSNADVNGDGDINILDLTLIASHFGESYSD